MRTEIVNTLLEARITAIVRGIAPEKLRRTADALCEGGVKTIEVTFDTPGAADMIRLLKKEYADKMLVGAGTVLDTETCRTAILAGAAGYVLKQVRGTDLVDAVRRVAAGQSLLDPSVTRRVLDRPRTRRVPILERMKRAGELLRQRPQKERAKEAEREER